MIIKGTVEGPVIGKSNQMSCRIDGGHVVPVTYTTPYGGWRTGDEDSVAGGIIAMPEPRSEVLITAISDKPIQTMEFRTGPPAGVGYYYISTILSSNAPAQAEGGEDPIKEHAPTKNIGGEEYKDESPISAYKWIPQRQAIENPDGTGIHISNSKNEEVDAAQVQLKTNFGEKKVALYNTDDNNSIEMETLYHDRIKLTQDEVDNAGAQELHIETESNQNYHCETGKIWIEVTEGLDVDIRNNSGGASKIPVSEEEFGNINLISRNMDINLTAEGRKEFIGNGIGSNYTLGSNVSGYDASTSYVDENGDPIDPMEGVTVPEEGGSIFIQALGKDNDKQLIQLHSKDQLIVYGKGNVYIGGDKIVIRAEDTIDISCKNKLSMHAGGNVQIDGAKIYLNDGFSYVQQDIEGELKDNHLGVGKTAPGDEPIKVEWLPQPEKEEEE